MGLGEWLTSKKGKTFMGYLYGIGASVVIVGALFKIQHWPGAGPMLIIGLSTEAVIFFFSAFEPVHMDLDWSLVYPELAHTHDEAGGEGHEMLEEADKGTVTEQLDKMLEEAKIGPELIESLGAGLIGLKDQTEKLHKLTDASVATEEFVTNVKGASSSASQLSDTLSNSAGELSDAYSKTAHSISQSADNITSAYSKTADQINKSADDFAENLARSASQTAESINAAYSKTAEHINKSATEMTENLARSSSELSETYVKSAESLKNGIASSLEKSGSYMEQVQSVTKNLSSLNSSYELHLKEMNESMANTNKLYTGIEQLLQNLNDSVEDTKKYKEGISELSKNLTALNTIYGNMLSAMSYQNRG